LTFNKKEEINVIQLYTLLQY